MLHRRPWAQSGGDHQHRTAWTADDRRQVEELMLRWRHNVPALEWERLARRRGRMAAALRAWALARPAAPLATAPVDGVADAPDPRAIEDRRPRCPSESVLRAAPCRSPR